MLQQDTRRSGILCQHQIDLFQDADGAQGHILHIAYRRRNDIQYSHSAGKCSIYLNGVLDHEYTTTIVPAFSSITTITAGIANNKSGYQTNCSINDIRIYDHCLSDLEVKEIAQGLILHYKLDGLSGGINSNLITKSIYTADP
jgi:hypothetical protein